ncbi:3'-5' exonuclease domain-containing protein 2 [Puniceicoccales bacterium CK1056]|uniref:3'-5' exonuclease n=1 Tax=Oceanipulchritudo coccoides TaxID=2706888 RepID=A0A6B2M657_9BACT|nr:3'-5' exonuclease [Oceanipulchritudo coccoides]NDV63285.1 3'-5' exonuclease domain-containing protein 2 [Oceanipulchritudo coccoides]
MSPAIKITKEEINDLPLNAYEGPITIVDDDEKLAKALKELRKEKILGFDTESRPSFKKGQNYPASLIQLGGEHHIWLFQISNFASLDALWEILADEEIIKAGVAIADDIKKLQELQDFTPGGFVEIATLSTQAGILNTGLRSLAALLLGFRISKRAQVSNWAKNTLTDIQIQYAATDAWVSRELYLHMQQLSQRAAARAKTASS